VEVRVHCRSLEKRGEGEGGFFLTFSFEDLKKGKSIPVRERGQKREYGESGGGQKGVFSLSPLDADREEKRRSRNVLAIQGGRKTIVGRCQSSQSLKPKEVAGVCFGV